MLQFFGHWRSNLRGGGVKLGIHYKNVSGEISFAPLNILNGVYVHIYVCFTCKRKSGVVGWCWLNFQCRSVLLILIIVGQGPTTLSVRAGGDCLAIFLSSIISLFFLLLSGRRPNIDWNTVSKCR